MPSTFVRPSVVGGNEAALDLHADLLEAEAAAVRAHADRDEDDVGDERVVLALAELELHRERAVGVLLVAESPSAFLKILAPCLHERFSTTAVHSGSTPGSRLGRRLDHRELGAELLVDHAELEADDAAADDEQALRHLLAGSPPPSRR